MKDPQRQLWNNQQKTLRQALTRPTDHQAAIDLFLDQHAMVHRAELATGDRPSFADEIWQDCPEATIRRLPGRSEHSIAWVIWHIARIEDVTMNMLVAGSPQCFDQDDWRDKLRSPVAHTGNAMDVQEVAQLSAAVDLEALRGYRLAVGRQTRAIVQRLAPGDLKQKVDPARLQRVMDEGAVIEAARGIVDYWSKRTIAGLLLMPPTRHNFLHLNEAQRLKHKK